jgi:hypothetical protein
MTEKTDNSKQPLHKLLTDVEVNFPAFPLYPVEEDIYNKLQQEEDIDPEDISKFKEANQNDEFEKGFDKDVSGAPLDVPGSELDDDQENIGSEDEENNSYSLGGDDHNDLEENKGE